MPIQLTTRKAIEWGANSLLDKQQLTPERKREIKAVTEFNLLTTVFNASTILLVAAVASAILFAYTAAFTLGALGLFLRYSTEREITKFTLPIPTPQEQVRERGRPAVLWERLRDAYNSALLRNALHQATPDEKIVNTFLNVGLPRQEGWEPTPILLDEFAIWREKIEVPPAVVPAAPAAPAPGRAAAALRGAAAGALDALDAAARAMEAVAGRED